MQDVAIDEKHSLSMVMELLVTIEVAATRFAAMRRTPEDLKRIRRALVGMGTRSPMTGSATTRISPSTVPSSMPPTIRTSARPQRAPRARCAPADPAGAQQYQEPPRGLVEAVQEEHKRIYDAIVAGDAERAAEAAESHLRNAAKRLNMYLKG